MRAGRPFHLLPAPRMDLFLTDNRGWGVVAAQPLSRGAFICEYAGEVVEEAESRARMAAAKAAGQAHFYMMELAPGLIIDARNKCGAAPASWPGSLLAGVLWLSHGCELA
jgi:hypothetical protein